MKKLVSVLLASAMCASLLTACGGSGSASKNAAESTQTAGKTTINIGINTDISSLDPHNHNDTASAYATRHIYSNLTKLNDKNEFVGELAESWEFKDDTTVEFTLKDGVKFHNGEPLTAEDVKFSLERQKKSPKVGHLVFMIDSIEVVDDLHFIIHMNMPSNALVSSLAHCGGAILCKSYVEGLEAEGKTLESAPMGTGSYKFEEWTPGATITLVKNEDYFDSSCAAQNDKLVFKVIPEEAARTIALENGELDLLVNVSTADANRIRDNAALALDEYESTQIEYMALNTSKPPFDNKLVRQAMNYAINKQDVLIAAIDGEGEPFDDYMGPAAIGYCDNAVKYEYNPEKAKELLAEAGYADGFTFTNYLSGDPRAKAATVIQANLKELGITMNIDQMEASTYYERTGNGEHDACMAGWVANAEPDNTYRPLFTSEKAGSGGNRAFYQNPEVDKLVDDATTNRDADAVKKDYEAITETVSDDAIWVPLFTKNGLIARNKDLKGFVPSAINMHDFYGVHY